MTSSQSNTRRHVEISTSNLPISTFNVVAMPHPLRPLRDVFAMGQGCTIEDAMLEAAYRGGARLEILAHAVAVLDGEIVEKSAWFWTQPKAGSHLLIRVVPGDPVSLVAVIASVAAYAAPGALASTGVMFSAGFGAALSAGVSLVAPLLSTRARPSSR